MMLYTNCVLLHLPDGLPPPFRSRKRDSRRSRLGIVDGQEDQQLVPGIGCDRMLCHEDQGNLMLHLDHSKQHVRFRLALLVLGLE
jgi:hypothetical protein